MLLQNAAIEAIHNHNYIRAETLFQDVAYGMEKLSEIDKDYYEPPLYVALLYLAKIYAFGLDNRWSAIKYLTRACSYARKCTAQGRSNVDIAKNDLEAMRDFLVRLEIGESLSDLRNVYGEGMSHTAAKQDFSIDNRISGIGCLVGITAIFLVCVVYAYVVLAN